MTLAEKIAKQVMVQLTAHNSEQFFQVDTFAARSTNFPNITPRPRAAPATEPPQTAADVPCSASAGETGLL